MFMDPGEECQARVEVLQRCTLDAAIMAMAEMDPAGVRRVSGSVIENRADAFRRALAVKQASGIESLKTKWTPEASM